jgi:gas vesicle protein
MDRDQTTEYTTAFVVGAILGVGAALLFAPDPPTRRERIMKELKPYRKQFKKRTARARKELGRQASVASEWSEELVAASRDVMRDLRDEVSELVADARNEIAGTVESQLESAQKALRKSAKRIGR